MQNNPSLYKSASGCGLTDFTCNFVSGIGPKVVEWILQFVALLTGIAAALLNGVVFYTIVQVKENYDNLQPLLATWQVIRDLANMSFIFILLYAGIRTMLGDGGETRKIIVGVVIAAILMNFSLFFTRLVIDAANVLALTFYNAISPNSLNTQGVFDWSNAGLATAFTDALHLQSFYDTSSTLNAGSIIVVGIMGSIMLLVAAFVFLAIALMFIIRYVVLLIVLILSPVFFLASAFPKGMGLEKYATQWKEALFNQAFFAPVFFLLIWISLRLLDGMMAAFGGGRIDATALNNLALGTIEPGNIEGAFMMFINFAIVIALLLTSLSVAKQMANKAGGGLSKATDWATGKAGNLTFGTVGWAGRNTMGRGAALLGESEVLKKAQNWSNKRGGLVGAATGFATRKTIEGSREVGKRSFDARGYGLGGKDAGKAGGKDGFTGFVKKKAEDEEKFAKSLGPSDATKIKADNELTFLKEQDEIVRANAEKYVNENFRKPSQLETLERDIATAEAQSRNTTMTEAGRATAAQRATELKAQAKPISENYERQKKEMLEREIAKSGVAARLSEAQSKVDSLKGINDDRAKEILKTQGFREKLEKEGKSKEEIDKAEKTMIAELKKNNPSAADTRKKDFANSVEKSWIAWGRGYNYAAAAKIRGGKSAKDEAAEALKKLAKESGVETEEQPKEDKGGREDGEKKEGGESKPAA